MTDLVFVDTNVWVYAVDAADLEKQARARAILDPRGGASIVTSAQVLGEFYTTVTRKLSRPVDPGDAARMVDRMRRLPVVEIDGDRVLAAIDGSRAWQMSYWDALIVVAAQASGCSRLLSEDLATGATFGGVRVENPFTPERRMAEERAAYAGARHAWEDADLDVELERYAQAGRDAGMRPNAVHSYWDYARRFLAWRTGDYRPRGAAVGGRPVPPGLTAADVLATQASTYADAIAQAGRAAATVETYHRHAMFFVRWLRGDFRPGDRLR